MNHRSIRGAVPQRSPTFRSVGSCELWKWAKNEGRGKVRRPKSFWTGLATVGLLFLAAQQASAVNDFCDFLTASECQVTASHAGLSGSYTIDRTLHIFPTGKLITGGADIDITITPSGDFLMDGGALIDAGVAGSPGGKITVTLDNGNVDLATGSIIRSNGSSGGAIKITTTPSHTANLDGLIESVGTISGVGGNQPPGGGTITIIAGCSLTVSDTGKISSRGADPGADLVHLEACTVIIDGLVESTGAGHVNPSNPANHCNLTPAAHDPTSAGHSQFFTGCVEIWSGTTVLIDSTGTHKGEVNANIGFTGGTAGRGWIDIYANGDITIKDGTGNNRNAQVPPNGPGTYATTFAVHSNGGILQNTDDGGLITIKSLFGNVVAQGILPSTLGDAIQADALSAGSNGGNIYVEAFNDVTLTTARIYARGDFVATGGFGDGGFEGTVARPIRAYTGAVSWTSGIGDVRPIGGAVPLANYGQINLEACTSPINTAGATFPTNGAVGPPFPTKTAPVCGGGPVKDTPGALPMATCLADFCSSTGSKCGKKFDDLNGNGMEDGGEPGIGNWPINLLTTGNVILTTITTNPDGTYCFPTLQPGTYRVCEGPPPAGFSGYVQTFPKSGVVHPGETVINTCPGPRVWGYQFTVTSNESFTGDDFGNHLSQCPEDSSVTPTKTVDPSQPQAGKNYQTLQAAYDAAANTGEIIGMFGNTVENVNLGGTKSMKITQCTLASITAANNALPVWNITSTGKLTIQGPDSVGGTIGWWIHNASGGPHTLKSVRANGASQDGILVASNGNSVTWNDASGNGSGAATDAGVRATGNSNTLKGGDTGPNNGDGIQLAGNSNNLSGATADSNTANGIVASGNSNTIKGNRASLNTLDGYKNAAGTSNNYSGNSSNTGGKENGGAEYRFITAGVNGGSNRADGTNVPSAGKCPTFPAAGTVCE